MSNIDEIAEEVRKIAENLNEKIQLRENLMLTSREAIRLCGEAISAIHRRELKTAELKLKEAKNSINIIIKAVEEHPELIGGTVITAMQEYVEAKSLYELVTKKRIPLINELNVLDRAYILGLADLIGEMRREAIELLKAEKLEDSEYMVELMERLHEILQPLEYPRSLVPELRSKIDIMRRLIEDTRRIVVDAIISIKLRRALEQHAKKHQKLKTAIIKQLS
ncbi:MAG: haloacid dehalogenase [Candidatus Methanomethylicota archaeon]|uniref:Haloacid dehalogenase n=1 Tax=Thermoproteota archaeon TaxID=2056631 RepID=A0A497F1S4_9CREN|nr:MAG: haloacid dehalogenase [Candidatus Verstraetearchaeota archaeon]